MPLIVLQSSALKAIEYHPRERELEVFFTDGTHSTYVGVPEKVYDEFMDAPSSGGYFNANIRNAYAKKI